MTEPQNQPNIDPAQQVPQAVIQNKRVYRRSVPLFFTLALVFFFFNFFTISCQDKEVVAVTGVQILLGKVFDSTTNDQSYIHRDEDEIPGRMWVIIAFISGVVGLGLCLLKHPKAFRFGIFAGALGAASLMIAYMLLISGNSSQETMLLSVKINFKFPFWGAVLSFIGAGFSSLISPKNTIVPVVVGQVPVITVPSPPLVAETPQTSSVPLTVVTPATDEKSQGAEAPPQNPLPKNTSQVVITIPTWEGIVKWVQEMLPADFQLEPWLNQNKVRLIGLGVVLLLGIGGYKLFIEKNPGSDGKQAALGYCDCNQKEINQAKIGLDSFIKGFESKNYTRRSAAQEALDSLTQVLEDSKLACLKKAEQKHNESKSRYVTSRKDLDQFDFSFSATQNICTNQNHLSENQKLKSEALELIGTIDDAESKVYDFLKQNYSNWVIKTDKIGKWPKTTMNQYILPERKNNMFFPYLAKGDFNKNGIDDFAVIVKNTYNMFDRVFVLMDERKGYWLNQRADAVGIANEPLNTDSDRQTSKTRTPKGDGLSLIKFGKSNTVVYWNGYGFR